MQKRWTKKNGAIETRQLWVAGSQISHYLQKELSFPGVQQAALLHKTSRNSQTGKTKTENWYILTSAPIERLSPEAFLKTIRDHWQVENSLHNVKDRALQEDLHVMPTPSLGPVLTTLRSLALNVLRTIHPPDTTKESIPSLALNFLMKPFQTMHTFLQI